MKKKILVVDDEPSSLELMRFLIEKAGYDVRTAKDGPTALSATYATYPDLMLLDVMLPGVSGYVVCKRLREDALFAHLPIIMVSAKTETEDKILGFKFGSDDYIAKPFDSAELLERIGAVLRRNGKKVESDYVTNLPGSTQIRKLLLEKLQDQHSFAVLYMDIGHLTVFNHHFGFQKGDLLIRFTVKAIQKMSEYYGSESDFLGCMAADKFVLLTFPERMRNLEMQISYHFEHEVLPRFFSEQERKFGTYKKSGGSIAPLPKLFIASAAFEKGQATHVGEIDALLLKRVELEKEKNKKNFLAEANLC